MRSHAGAPPRLAGRLRARAPVRAPACTARPPQQTTPLPAVYPPAPRPVVERTLTRPPAPNPDWCRMEEALGDDGRPFQRPVLRLPDNDDTLLTRIEPGLPVSSMIFKLRCAWRLPGGCLGLPGGCLGAAWGLPVCAGVQPGFRSELGLRAARDSAVQPCPAPHRLPLPRPTLPLLILPRLQAQLARNLELPGWPDGPGHPQDAGLPVSEAGAGQQGVLCAVEAVLGTEPRRPLCCDPDLPTSSRSAPATPLPRRPAPSRQAALSQAALPSLRVHGGGARLRARGLESAGPAGLDDPA